MAKKFDIDTFLANQRTPAMGRTTGQDFDIDTFLAKYRNPTVGMPTNMVAAGQPGADDDDGPGLIESVGRGVAQGGTLGFADEISGAIEAAFTDKTYRQARDESRTNFRAAEEAHPIGYGIGQVLGGVATAAVPGTLAARGALAGAKGAAVAAGAESAVAAVGASESEKVSDWAKDAVTQGATGAALGYGLGKVFSKYADASPERHVKNLTKDLTAGATPTESKRFATSVGELADDVLDADKEFMKAARKDPTAAAEVAKSRLDDLSEKVTPIYRKLDKEQGEIPLTAVRDHFDQAIEDAASKPGLERLRDALEDTRDNFVQAYARKIKSMGPEADIDTLTVPHQEVRQWVTRLMKQTTKTMGGLDELALHDLRSRVHATAHDFLRTHLDAVKTINPDLTDDIERLGALNRKIRAYASAESLMEHTASRDAWKKPGLVPSLSKAGLPVVAGAIGAGADLVTGGLAYAGTRAAAAGATGASKAATKALAGLVKGVRAGDTTKKAVLDAIKLGVPVATVAGLLATWRSAPEWAKDLGGELASGAYDAATD